ncbi:hypothetical protein [Rubrivivax gelatinosus]|uniref:Ribbon-helix-helix CopG family protein n=1 Tax=Rubrivivax gelatinosus (strain NBRC 100245 / IL144) TaxID=983917 RepID=I0HTK3_RUBGI|nr:hypothetical protein [Rubrivivax gelatinosus]BAL96340.1 hypothetical protein RGE_30010 [Rubrivivax gelatinosus IL144]
MKRAGPFDAAKRVPPARDRVTVDLRGWGPRLQAQASRRGMSAAAIVRRAVLDALSDAESAHEPERAAETAHGAGSVKLTLRLSPAYAAALAERARAAELSQGRYVETLLDGAPTSLSADDRIAVLELATSNDNLAAMSVDLNAFLRALARADSEAAERYREDLTVLAHNVRSHLAIASALSARLQGRRARR